MRLGLLMGSDSRKRREYLGEALRIGYCNGKQLLKRLGCLEFVWPSRRGDGQLLRRK